MIRLKWVEINRKAYPTSVSPRGRRMSLERAVMIGMLDPDQLYCPSEISATVYPRESREYDRTRKALWHFAQTRGLSDSYDNLERGDQEPPKWFGSSWQSELGPRMLEVADLMDRLKALIEAHPNHDFFLDKEKITMKQFPMPDSPSEPEATESGHGTQSPIPVRCVELAPLDKRPQRIGRKGSWRLAVWLCLSMLVVCGVILGHQIYLPKKQPQDQHESRVNETQETFMGTNVATPLSQKKTYMGSEQTRAGGPQLFLLSPYGTNDPDIILKIAIEQGYDVAAEKLVDTTPFQFGMDLIQKHGKPEAGLHWFRAMSAQKNISGKMKEEFLFGEAWALWWMSDMLGAIKIATALEATSNEPLLSARLAYLLGDLHYTLGKFSDAQAYYLRALSYYRLQDRTRMVIRCNVALATIAASTQPEQVSVYVDAAKKANLKLVEMNQTPYDEADFAGIYRDAAFTLGNYEESLRWAKEEERLLRRQPEKTNLRMLSTARVGILLAIVGDYKGATLVARELDHEAEKFNSTRAKSLNIFTYYYIGRCKGIDTSVYEKEIKNFGQSTNDFLYSTFIERLNKIPCK